MDLSTELEGPPALRASKTWGTTLRVAARPAGARGAGTTRGLDEPLVAAPRALAAALHVEPVRRVATELVSGERRAELCALEPGVLLGLGPESDLWVWIEDDERRPRSDERLNTALPVRVEPNGLLRVLERRVAVSTVLDALANLGLVERAATDPALRIPKGRYGQVSVRDAGRHYEVRARGGAQRRIARLAFEPSAPRTWVVLEESEPRLRRELVRQLTPLPYRLILGALGRLAPGPASRRGHRASPGPDLRPTRAREPGPGRRRLAGGAVARHQRPVRLGVRARRPRRAPVEHLVARVVGDVCGDRRAHRLGKLDTVLGQALGEVAPVPSGRVGIVQARVEDPLVVGPRVLDRALDVQEQPTERSVPPRADAHGGGVGHRRVEAVPTHGVLGRAARARRPRQLARRRGAGGASASGAGSTASSKLR